MDGSPDQLKYLLVEASVLPDAFLRVVQAKQLLAQGKVRSLSEAAEAVEISRSTFYKYKDKVFVYESDSTRQVITFYAELEDRAGVLSSLLSVLSERGANVLTINQNIPVDGVAPVSVSLRADGLKVSVDQLSEDLRRMDGVVALRVLSN